MLAQVVNFTVEQGSQAKLLSVIERWKSGRGKALAGCNQLITCIDNDGFGQGSVIILFDTQEALDKFSADSESSKAFEDAVSHANGESVVVYEADAAVHSLA